MVSTNLRRWFVVHFVADMLFGIPLLIAPGALLSLFGWQTIDPFTARLVGAALLGIGGESLLSRNASVETYCAMLNLKLIWSGSALLGMVATLVAGDAPVMGWLAVAIFTAFHAVWWYYRLRLRAVPDAR